MKRAKRSNQKLPKNEVKVGMLFKDRNRRLLYERILRVVGFSTVGRPYSTEDEFVLLENASDSQHTMSKTLKSPLRRTKIRRSRLESQSRFTVVFPK